MKQTGLRLIFWGEGGRSQRRENDEKPYSKEVLVSPQLVTCGGQGIWYRVVVRTISDCSQFNVCQRGRMKIPAFLLCRIKTEPLDYAKSAFPGGSFVV